MVFIYRVSTQPKTNTHRKWQTESKNSTILCYRCIYTLETDSKRNDDMTCEILFHSTTIGHRVHAFMNGNICKYTRTISSTITFWEYISCDCHIHRSGRIKQWQRTNWLIQHILGATRSKWKGISFAIIFKSDYNKLNVYKFLNLNGNISGCCFSSLMMKRNSISFYNSFIEIARLKLNKIEVKDISLLKKKPIWKYQHFDWAFEKNYLTICQNSQNSSAFSV